MHNEHRRDAPQGREAVGPRDARRPRRVRSAREDGRDEPRTRRAGADLDEQPHAVAVGGLDDGGEVDGLPRLRQDRVGPGVRVERHDAPLAGAVEADAGDLVHGQLVKIAIRLRDGFHHVAVHRRRLRDIN